MWIFIDLLQKDGRLNNLKIEQFIAGVDKKMYKNSAIRLQVNE